MLQSYHTPDLTISLVAYCSSFSPSPSKPARIVGSWKRSGFLTTDQLRKRDRLVFEAAHSLGIPIAWNLAGDYQVDSTGGIQAVLDIHDNTMRECVAAYLAPTETACR